MKISPAKFVCGLTLWWAIISVSAQTAGVIYGSGQGSSSTDPNWSVVALPSSYGASGAVYDSHYGDLYSNPWYGYAPWAPSSYPGYQAPSTSFAAYVPSTLPGSYYGQNGQSGNSGVNVGGNVYHWIAPTPDASAVFGSPYNQSDYNWIADQTFFISQSGYYAFNFQASGDNVLQFFVDGSISTALMNGPGADNFAAANGYYVDSAHPTILGGTAMQNLQTGTTRYDNFGALGDFSGSVYLTAGDHEAYMVLHDLGGATAAFINESTFNVAPAPEPSAMVLAGIGGACLLLYRRRN